MARPRRQPRPSKYRLSCDLDERYSRLLYTLCDNESITATEAVKRGLKLYEIYQDTIRANGKLLVRDKDKDETVIRLVF